MPGTIIVLLLGLAPCVALGQSDRISYDYFHVGGTQAEVDVLGLDIDADGPELEGAFEVGRYVYLFASFASVEFDDIEDADAEFRVYGAGAHYDFQDNLSVYAGLGYTQGDLEAGNASAGDDGLYLRAGVRYMPGRRFEVRGGIERADFDGLGDDIALTVGGNVYLTDVVTVDLGYRHYDDISFASVGARFFFGNQRRRAWRY